MIALKTDCKEKLDFFITVTQPRNKILGLKGKNRRLNMFGFVIEILKISPIQMGKVLSKLYKVKRK